ncbi:FAD-dependent oxidoreductase [Tepidanaerobacter syntrophicus]|uniref:oxidoreductase n=1 Tax=Tepidanaerobacter syntrophicus TaxID=224999 RepID=UPI001BD64AF7|nr:FAD-dependent oxidoreductase [Tepidanaerobacter syntrophicus]
MRYTHLFSPIKINKMIVRNRIVATPIGQKFYDKSLGGPGIVIAGSVITEPGRSSWASADEPYAFSKYEVEKTRQRMLIAKQAGAKASIEIGHAGQYARVKDYAKGPSGFIREDGVEVKEMTEEMMEETLSWYERTAFDAKDIGFDMIFMHFGHGWLAAQFLSPLFNKRTDKYGGSIENRARFPKMILERVRKTVGPDFPIDMRISATECVEGGIEFEDVLTFIKMVEHLIDSVQISRGLDMVREANVQMATTNFAEHMINAEYAKKVKKNVSIPVAVVGAIIMPDEAEHLIADGFADMAALGRALVADPDWPKKAMEGRSEDIAPCIRCLQCYHISTDHRNVGCSVNPRYSNEFWIPREIKKADTKKKIAIIGGGPAGLEAALIADKRGHEVSLFEKNDFLGGELHYISMEHYKQDIKTFLDYLKAQISRSNVKVQLKTEATPEMIKEIMPNALILAIGAKPATIQVPGINRKNVINFYDAIEHPDKIGQEVVIIGGGTIGAEIGLELSLLNHKNVTIIELTNQIASQGNMLYRIALNQKIKEADTLKIMLNTICKEIKEDGVIVQTSSHDEEFIKADSIIVAVGLTPNAAIAENFYGIVPETFTIGDCVKPRKIMESVFEGFTIGINL